MLDTSSISGTHNIQIIKEGSFWCTKCTKFIDTEDYALPTGWRGMTRICLSCFESEEKDIYPERLAQ